MTTSLLQSCSQLLQSFSYLKSLANLATNQYDQSGQTEVIHCWGTDGIKNTLNDFYSNYFILNAVLFTMKFISTVITFSQLNRNHVICQLGISELQAEHRFP